MLLGWRCTGVLVVDVRNKRRASNVLKYRNEIPAFLRGRAHHRARATSSTRRNAGILLRR